MEKRTLFSVIQFTDDNGSSWCEVDWHPEMYRLLDDISPNSELTDRIIDIADELLEEESSTTPSSGSEG